MDEIREVALAVAEDQRWIPLWLLNLLMLGAAALLAVTVHRFVFRAATRFVADKELLWRSLVARTEGPARLGIIIISLSIASTAVPLTPHGTAVLRHILLLSFICLVGWVAMTAMHIWITIYLRRFKLEAEDNLLARKHVTQARVLQRVAGILITLITASAALMTFEDVRQYGVSLLASAGAAGLVLGLALQPLLKNMFAGIQLAVAQPIRLGDALLVENEWGTVEEITSSYVVLRLWDWRRLVLPLTYFIDKPFQNWTRESTSLIGTVLIYLDHTAPVAAIRDKLQEILRASPLWDRQVAAVQVTDFREYTMEVRMLVSASNAGRTFDLRCEVREKMIDWLKNEYPHALPRRRADIDSLPREMETMRQAAPRSPAPQPAG